MKSPKRKSRFGWEDVRDSCETLSEADDAHTRDLAPRISDKWSLWTMSAGAHLGQPMRFSRIMDQVDRTSQKSLTKTLPGLERDGLVTRQVSLRFLPGLNTASQPSGPRCSTTSHRSGAGWQSVYSLFRTTERRLIVVNSGGERRTSLLQ